MSTWKPSPCRCFDPVVRLHPGVEGAFCLRCMHPARPPGTPPDVPKAPKPSLAAMREAVATLRSEAGFAQDLAEDARRRASQEAQASDARARQTSARWLERRAELLRQVANWLEGEAGGEPA